jgi:leucyl aminopeptidase (aminopeptidase T)
VSPSAAALDTAELVALVRRVFRPTHDDRRLAFLVDLPREPGGGDDAWRERRAMAADWARRLGAAERELGLAVSFAVYPAVGANNADLPARMWLADPSAPPDHAGALDPADAVALEEVLGAHSILIAPTEYSATAPLKLLANRYGFRAATMPGFSAAMIPALRLDYTEIGRRVRMLKSLLDDAHAAQLEFAVAGGEPCALTLDLRHRKAHASDGILDRPGIAGNLPSGEAYIVPYEGEREGDPSRSFGTLPVQFGDEVVRFAIEANRAVRATGEGAAAREQADWLAREPAYGNLAELGLGVLADFGLAPTGETLLDEKLGLHIAFGRSDHFGGQVGAARFSRPEAVVHIDRVYIPSLQPRVTPALVDLVDAHGAATPLMRDGRYVVGF